MLNNKKKEKLYNDIQNKVKDSYLNKYTVQFIFFLICFAFMLAHMHLTKVPINDGLFHYLSWKDASVSIMHGKLPSFNIYTGQPLGIATNSFYPWIVYLPIILLCNVFSTNVILNLIFFLCSYLVTEIIYFSFRHFLHKSILYSFLISLSILCSTVFYTIDVDYGSKLSFGFFVFSYIGWILWIRKCKWKLLCIGEILIAFSNIPSLFISIILLIILSLLNIKKIHIKHYISLIKSVFVFFLSVSIFYLPLIILHISNDIFTPNKLKIQSLEMMPVFNKTSRDIFTWILPDGYTTWGIMDIIAIVLIIKFFRYLILFQKQLSFLGIVIIIINCVPIQKFLLQETFLRPLQYLSRFSIYGHFMLMIPLINILFLILYRVRLNSHKMSIYFGIIDIILIFSSLFIIFGLLINNLRGTQYCYHPSISTVPRKRFSNAGYVGGLNGYNDKDYIYNNYFSIHKNAFHITLPPNYFDYSPRKIIGTLRQSNKQKIMSTDKSNIVYDKLPNRINASNYGKNNTLNVYSHRIRNVVLPLIIYHQQKYIISDNNQNKHIMYKRGYSIIKLNKGNNRIRVYTPIMWYRYLSIFISILGLIILITI